MRPASHPRPAPSGAARRLLRPPSGVIAPAVLLVAVLTAVVLLAGACGPERVENGAPADVEAPEEPAEVDEPDEDVAEPDEDGEELFAANCASCHGGDGTGAGGVPSLVDSAEVTADDPDEMIATVLFGRGGMPPFEQQLDDGELAALLTHVRELGDAAPIAPHDVEAVREAQ